MPRDYTDQNVMQWLDEEEEKFESQGRSRSSIGWSAHIPRLALEYGVSEQRLRKIMRKWGAHV